jgi:Tfp pilus assembly protein PilF
LAYLLAGRIDSAKKFLRELHELTPKAYVSPVAFAYIYIFLGEIDKAFDSLEKAVDEPDGMVMNVSVVPMLIE